VTRRVLVVDDEKGIREALRQLLEYEEFEVRTVASGMDAQKAYAEFHPHLVFLDVKMQGMDGLETLKRLRQADPGALVVMISGHGTIQTAVEATQLGAYDFLEKPLDTDRVLLTLRNALSHVDLASENTRLKAEVTAQYEIVGSSKSVRALIERIEKVAPTTARVLITGENGTGKELVARAIHALSPRAKGPFVEVNCAAIPSELIESELFGHMKGSFTGAVGDRPGKFELADGGTLFLDEITEMPQELQVKLLRVLESGTFMRVGMNTPIATDVRLIAATNRVPEKAVAEGKLREDLYHRINVFPIQMPLLRDRGTDIELLAQHFLDVLNREEGTAKAFSPAAIAALYAHRWPGNVRELKNYVQRAFILADDEIDADLAPETFVEPDHSSILTVRIGSSLEEVNRRVIEATLAECGNVKRKAAETLGISLKTLYNRLAVYQGKRTGDARTDEDGEVGAEPAAAPPAKSTAAPTPQRTV
jgi:DNA-binding NtrC family response regulator